MKLLITGSNGMTGQAITRLAKQHPGIEIIATSATPNRNPQVSRFELLDITYQEKINYLLDLYHPDCVINTAAISQVDTCEKDKSLSYKVNFDAVQKLSGACSLRDIHFIHLSSDFVFDGRGLQNYEEEDNRSPVNYYGECKLLAEKYMEESAGNNCIVRTALVYDYPKEIRRKNIFRWIYDSLKTGQSIRLANDQFRTPTFVDDLASALLTIARDQREGVFHISGKEQVSVFDFGLKIARHFGMNESLISPVPSAALNQTARRPQKTSLDISKAEEDLNYKPYNISSAFDVIKSRI